MKEINEEMINRLWMSKQGLKPMKWNEIYDTEEELIHDLKCIDVSPLQPMHKIPMGYEFLQSFQSRVNKDIALTEKQMTQLKRLAVSVAFKKYIQG